MVRTGLFTLPIPLSIVNDKSVLSTSTVPTVLSTPPQIQSTPPPSSDQKNGGKLTEVPVDPSKSEVPVDTRICRHTARILATWVRKDRHFMRTQKASQNGCAPPAATTSVYKNVKTLARSAKRLPVLFTSISDVRHGIRSVWCLGCVRACCVIVQRTAHYANAEGVPNKLCASCRDRIGLQERQNPCEECTEVASSVHFDL